jgi:hypothetical protein
MARYKGFYIDPNFFRQVEEFIQDNRHSAKNVKFGMDAVVMLYAMTALGEAQRRSRGPVDPRETGRRLSGHRFIGSVSGPSRREPLYSPTAWKIPVRRITGAYFSGWYTQRLALAYWMLSNHSREAYFIEFGINHQGTGVRDTAGNRVRIRRPILKLSVLAAYNIASQTNMDTGRISRNICRNVSLAELYASPTHGANRTYPVNANIMNALQNVAASGGAEA